MEKQTGEKGRSQKKKQGAGKSWRGGEEEDEGKEIKNEIKMGDNEKEGRLE